MKKQRKKDLALIRESAILTAANRLYSNDEQRAALEAPAVMREKLASLNDQYEKKFGYRYLVNASGRSAEEVLKFLEDRLQNFPDVELGIASRERGGSTHYDSKRPSAKKPHDADRGCELIATNYWKLVGNHISVHCVAVPFCSPGYGRKQMWPLVVAIAVFTCWDALWIFLHDSERNAQEMLDTSTRARTYMSYFVAIYGAGIVFVLPVSDK